MVNDGITVDWENNRCVVCGPANPQGLHARFEARVDGTPGVESRFAVPQEWQGFSGLVHGGMLAGVLDDAMWYAIYLATGLTVMTADLDVRYRKPVPTDVLLHLVGTVTEHRHKLVIAQATLAEAEAPTRVLVSARGKFLPAP